MSIPYSTNLSWNNFNTHPNWFVAQKDQAIEKESELTKESQAKRALSDISNQVFKQPIKRGIQFLRDAARLILKTPIRCIYRPIVEKCLWRQVERTAINGKLAFYSFVQLASVPFKFLVALIALSISPFSGRKAKWLQDKSEDWTQNIDGRMSKLEALKEEGLENSTTHTEFLAYKKWIQQINPHLCRKSLSVNS